MNQDEAIRRLNEMEDETGGKYEDLHIEADGILCARLIALGENAVVDAYKQAKERIIFFYA